MSVAVASLVAVGKQPSLAWLCQRWFFFADRCCYTTIIAIADKLFRVAAAVPLVAVDIQLLLTRLS